MNDPWNGSLRTVLYEATGARVITVFTVSKSDRMDDSLQNINDDSDTNREFT